MLRKILKLIAEKDISLQKIAKCLNTTELTSIKKIFGLSNLSFPEMQAIKENLFENQYSWDELFGGNNEIYKS